MKYEEIKEDLNDCGSRPDFYFYLPRLKTVKQVRGSIHSRGFHEPLKFFAEEEYLPGIYYALEISCCPPRDRKTVIKLACFHSRGY